MTDVVVSDYSAGNFGRIASEVGFRETHRPPRFYANGKDIPAEKLVKGGMNTSILAENIKVPLQWAQSASSINERMTKTKLDMLRRKSNLPHPSFDVDQDGHVSVTDLFLAKRFDKDKDGKLNEEELANAKQAIASGYKDQFVFGLERTGAI